MSGIRMKGNARLVFETASSRYSMEMGKRGVLLDRDRTPRPTRAHTLDAAGSAHVPAGRPRVATLIYRV